LGKISQNISKLVPLKDEISKNLSIIFSKDDKMYWGGGKKIALFPHSGTEMTSIKVGKIIKI
jgi:hypothetical protein